MKKIFLLLLLFVCMPLAAEQTVQINNLDENDPNCPNGGIVVLVGENTDSNEALEGEEIQSYAYVCKGEKGCDILVTAVTSNSYSDCKIGTTQKLGVLISSGVDCDSNGVIDSGQAAETVLCYGTKGSNGGFSVEGGKSDGGTDGTDGKATAFIVTEDSENHCAAGGKKIEIGADTDGNGVLDENEIQESYYVCNGESPQGSQGEQGKQGIAGMDGKDGADGAKGERGDKGEQGEAGIAGEPGENGADGYDSLLSVIDEPAGDNCENGGKKFLSGIDSDRNGVLDESEVKNSYYICNGENAAEASEQVASSGCTLSSIGDNSGFESFYSVILNICRFVSDLF